MTQDGHQLRRTGDELEEAVKRVYATPAERRSADAAQPLAAKPEHARTKTDG